MTKGFALLAVLVGAIALVVGLGSTASARPMPFTCSYSGNTTIQWHSDKLNKLQVDEVTVQWQDGFGDVIKGVDDVFNPPRPGGRLSWPTPPGTVYVNYDVKGTINGGAEEPIYAGFTQCSP